MTINYINNLLQDVTVEWKALGDIFDLKNGYTPSKSNKKYWENGTIPWFRMDDIRENGQILNQALQQVTKSAVKSGKLFPANSIIMATSATIGEHALITVPYLSNQRFTNLSLKAEYRDIFEIKFLFYYCFLLDEWCKNNTTISSFASVDMSGFKKFQIPIPPLEVQAHIVRILDTFTELTAELTAELTIRRKQYEYYREQLLTFDDTVEWRSLGEIAKIYDGTHQTPKYTSFGIPFVSVENIKNLYGTKKYISVEDFNKYKYKPQKDDLFMTRIGDIGTCAIVKNDEPLAYYVTLSLIRVNQKLILPKYLKFVIESSIGKLELYKRTLIHATPIKINLGDIGKIEIPIPSLEKQAHIVSILDKFDTLTNSITEGLPREIELRRQQYEYYREQLLTFPQP